MQSPTFGSGSDEEYFTSGGRRNLCRSKNAVLARENRVRKKMYVNGLERQISALRTENKRVKAIADTQLGLIADQRSEIRYLRSVLANSKEIGRLLRKIGPTPPTPPPVDLSFSSFGFDDPLDSLGSLESLESLELFPETACSLPPRPTGDDHNYSAQSEEEPVENAGVCLHVSGGNVSLEFCSVCNRRALDERNC